MFSKWMVLLTALGGFFLASCNWPLHEEPPKPDPLKIELGDTADCLSHVKPVMRLFIEGAAPAPQLSATWNCVISAVETFEKSVRGRKYEDRFTDRELAHFLETYFIEGETRIPDSLLHQVFLVKQLFVGGDADTLTRNEMRELRKVLGSLRDMTVRLNPFMDVYNLSWKPSAQATREEQFHHFEQADFAFRNSASELAALITQSGSSYKLDNAIQLCKELESFNEGHWKWLPTAESALPLLRKLKKGLLGGSEEEIVKSEWQRFLILGSRGFTQYLRYHYFIETIPADGQNEKLEALTLAARDFIDLIEGLIESKPGGARLTLSEISEVAEALRPLFPSFNFSHGLLLELMRLKVALLGGQVDSIHKDEFAKAARKLDSFKSLAESFLKYSHVYARSWVTSNLAIENQRDYFRRAESALQVAAANLGRLMEGPYDLKNLESLVREFEKTGTSPSRGKSLTELTRQFLPVLISVKNLVLSDQGSFVGAISSSGSRDHRTPQDQWALFLRTAADIFSRYLYYDYFVSGKDLFQQPALSDLDALVLDGTQFLNSILASRPNQMISFAEIQKLLRIADDLELLPKAIDADLLEPLVKVAVQRIFLAPEKRLAGSKPQGLTTETTTEIRSEFALWIEVQKFLETQYRGVPEAAGKSGSALRADLAAASQASKGLREMQMLLDVPMEMSFDDQGRLFMGDPTLNYQYGQVTKMNAVRAAVRMLIRSYAQDNARIQSYAGVSVEETNQLFEDVRALAIKAGLISPTDLKFAESRFRDSNLFSPVGNGDSLMDFKEGSNLALLILSGLKLDHMMFESMESFCQIRKEGPLKENWKADVVCVEQFYRQRMPQVFASLPDFMKYQASLDEPGFHSIFMNLLKAAGHVPQADGTVKISDLSLFPHVVQYVEAVYRVFDVDRSGTLTTPEALKAYPRYRQILKDVSGLSDERQLKGLFTWMLDKGKPPETAAEKAKFIAFWVPQGENGWKIAADRSRLASILGYIADALAKPKPVPGGASEGANSGTP